MKKMTVTALICALMLCAGCNNAVGNKVSNKKPSTDITNDTNFVPDDLAESEFAYLSSAAQNEIKSLCGYYWMDGKKDNCIEIGENKLVSYSTAMSARYIKVRWAKVSDTWICCSYKASDNNCTPQGRRVILKCKKKKTDTGWTIRQYVVPMGIESGPFVKGGAVEKKEIINKAGVKETVYVYDKNDDSAPQMLEPQLK